VSQTDNPTHDQDAPAPAEFVVRRAKGPLLNGAIERLIESSGRTGPRAVRDFLSAARRHGISIEIGRAHV